MRLAAVAILATAALGAASPLNSRRLVTRKVPVHKDDAPMIRVPPGTHIGIPVHKGPDGSPVLGPGDPLVARKIPVHNVGPETRIGVPVHKGPDGRPVLGPGDPLSPPFHIGTTVIPKEDLPFTGPGPQLPPNANTDGGSQPGRLPLHFGTTVNDNTDQPGRLTFKPGTGIVSPNTPIVQNTQQQPGAAPAAAPAP